MHRVEGDDQAGARKASAETRAQTLGTITAGSDRGETIVAEGNGGTGLAGYWLWRVAVRPAHPGDHQVLQTGDRLALEACRLLALEIGLGRRSAGVVQDRLCRKNVASGRTVMLGRDGSAKQRGSKAGDRLTRLVGMGGVPLFDAAVGAIREPQDSPPEDGMFYDRGAVAQRAADWFLIDTARQEQPILLAGRRRGHDRFGQGQHHLDQVRRGVPPAPIERPSLRFLEPGAGLGLGPFDNHAMFVERVRNEAVAADVAQRFRIGGGLDGDRQEERNERVGGDVEILRNGAVTAPESDERGGPDPVFFESGPVGHEAAFDPADPPYPSVEPLAAQRLGRELGTQADLLPVLKPRPDLVDLLIAGAQYRLDLIRRKPAPRLLVGPPAGKRVPGNLQIARERTRSIALAPHEQGSKDIKGDGVRAAGRARCPFLLEPEHITAEGRCIEIASHLDHPVIGNEAGKAADRSPGRSARGRSLTRAIRTKSIDEKPAQIGRQVG